MKNLKKFGLLLSVGVFLSTILLSTLSPLAERAFANQTIPGEGGGGKSDTYEKANLATQAKSNLYFYAMNLCVEAAKQNLKINLNDTSLAKSQEAIAGWQLWDSARLTYVSPVLDADDSTPENGISGCANADTLDRAFDLWGVYTPEDAYCKSHVIEDTSGAVAEQTTLENFCLAGARVGGAGGLKFVEPNDGVAFRKYINGRYYSKFGSASAPSYTDAQRYYILYQSFEKACRSHTTAVADKDIDDKKKHGYSIYTINSPTAKDGDAHTNFFFDRWEGYKNTGDGYKEFPLSVGVYSTNDFDGTTYKCGQLASALKGENSPYVKAIAKYIKDHPKDNSVYEKPDTSLTIPDPTDADADAAGSSTEDVSCESTGFPFSWVICKVIELAAEATDAMFNIVNHFLKTDPLVAEKGDPIFEAWSNFRTYGNIFLVIALLVIVLGESLGGGLIDAYAVKKILPRILAASILINVSFYLVAIANDIANIVGLGLRNLITAPFTEVKELGIHVGGVEGLVGFIGAGGAAWAVGAAVGATLFSGPAFAVFCLFVVLPVVFIVVGILVTIFVRQALIVFLVVISPVAFALYCLPNTEKYFRQWWDFLFKALLVYPIITTLIALADVMGVLMENAIEGPVGSLLAILAFITPLFMIPFAFKLAGGVLGRLIDLAGTSGKRMSEGIKGNVNDQNSLRNRFRTGFGSRWINERERHVNRVADAGRGVSGFARRRKAGLLNYGNLQARRSYYNKLESDRMQAQIDTGDDTNIRDTLIEWDDQGGKDKKGGWYRRMDMERDANGSLRGVAGASAVYEGAGAKQRGANAKRLASGLHGNDKSRLQKALYYEWKKTGFDDRQMDRIIGQYDDILKDHGLNAKEGAEMGKGVGFGHQGSSLASKHSTFGKNKRTGAWGIQVDHTALAKEGGFNIGTYQWSGQDVLSFDELSAGYDHAVEILSQSRYSGAADTDVIPIGAFNEQTHGHLKEYEGKTVGQVKENAWRIREIAATTNPNQAGLAPGLQAQTTAAQGAGQNVAYGGVSNAPVEVQEAARRLVENVRVRDQTPGYAPPAHSGRTPRSTT